MKLLEKALDKMSNQHDPLLVLKLGTVQFDHQLHASAATAAVL